MQTQSIFDEIGRLLGNYVPSLLGALAILIIGWLVAWAVSAIVGRALARTSLDDRLGKWIAGDGAAERPKAESWIARGVFWLIMLFVLVAFLQVLGLTVITQPLNTLLGDLLQYLPRFLGAALLLAIAWVIATVLRLVVTRGLTAFRVDERLGGEVEAAERRGVVAGSIGEAVYWLVFLLFLPAILGALALEGLLTPVQTMMNQILSFLPNILAAGIILLVGWFVARIVQRIVTNVLAGIGVDRLSDNVGLSRYMGTQKLSGLLGLIVYILILLPVLISALNTLALEAVTRPASNLLDTMLAAIPAIFAALLVLGVAYLVGRIVAGLVTSLLTGLGFNSIPQKLGLGKAPTEGQRTISEMAGILLMVAIMLFAAIEASRLLGFVLLAQLVTQFTVLLGQILMGLIIIAVGLYFASLAAKAVMASGIDQAPLLSLITRASIIVLAGAMGLRQMGLANEIITLAFGLILGAVVVAGALAFGLGGREIAAREIDGWLSRRRASRSIEVIHE